MIHVEQVEPDRDRNGKPILDGVSHDRCSQISNLILDNYGITKWERRTTALGYRDSQQLYDQLRATDPIDRNAIDQLNDDAKRLAGGEASRDEGIAIHATVEALLKGHDITGTVSDQTLADAGSFLDAMEAAHLEPVMSEVFIQNTELKAAGTFDILARTANGTTGIIDIKTSSNPRTKDYAAVAWAIQIAVYAHGVPYCAEQGRLPWHTLGVQGPSLETGIVAHIVQGTGTCHLYKVDIREGWRRAQLAPQIREARRTKGLVTPL